MNKLQQAMDLLREYCASRGDDDFVDAVEAEIAALVDERNMLKANVWSAQAQAEAWKAMLQWTCEAPSHADKVARMCYAEALYNGTPFEDWYEDIAGRDAGHNAPPPAVLMVLRPYLLGKVSA